MIAWSSVLGNDLVRAAPMAIVAVLLMSRRMSARTGAILLLLWLPASLLLAGLPLAVIDPTKVGATENALQHGLATILVPHGGPIGDDQWALGSALLMAGFCWAMAGLVSFSNERIVPVLSFLLLAVPLASAISLRQTHEAAWHGALVFAAALLWLTRGRLSVGIPAVLAVVGITYGVASVLGPNRGPWFTVGGSIKPRFTTLETEQTYGPLQQRRTHSTMFEITAPAPALWRMQVLEDFDGRGFVVDHRIHPTLDEPAAKPVTATVHIKDLQNGLAIAPGRITDVKAKGFNSPATGESRLLTPHPIEGDTYSVTSDVVTATADELKDVQIPTGEQYDRLTRFFQAPSPSPIARPVNRVADRLPPGYGGTPLARVLTLSRDLTRDATSEIDAVRRVQQYLLDPNRFTYTTDVQPGGAQPLVDFLLTTHAGYCQHFAGAAALLLRLDGIPTRVVAGFATGDTSGGGKYTVTDDDAHAWIEVYFEGYGWVPFNPTPLAAEAKVAPAVDVFTDSRGATAGGSGWVASAVLGSVAVLLVVGGVLRWRRREPGESELGDLLASLADEPLGPDTTFSAMQPELERIGPATVQLAAAAEHERFAVPDDAVAPQRRGSPRWRVWRALTKDLGLFRGTTLLARRAAGF
jgi:transglutaminase-like putative cysteine protease